MNLLYYYQHFSTPSGSTSTRAYEFAKKMVSKGHNVTIVCGSYWIADTGLVSDFINNKSHLKEKEHLIISEEINLNERI